MYNLINAFAVEYYIGEKRSGKTGSMTWDTYNDIIKHKCPNIKIYSNYKLNKKYFPNYELITKKELVTFYKHKVEFYKCIFLIDEIHIWFDSRNHSETENKAISYLLGQSGKRGIVIRGTMHDDTLIDIRGRQYAELKNYCYKGLIDKTGNWKQLINYNENLTGRNHLLYIKVSSKIKKMVETSFLPEFRYISLKPRYIKGQEFFDMYDTEELIV